MRAGLRDSEDSTFACRAWAPRPAGCAGPKRQRGFPTSGAGARLIEHALPALDAQSNRGRVSGGGQMHLRHVLSLSAVLQLAGPKMLTDTQRCELPEPGDDITDTRCDRAAAASRASSPLLDTLTDINLDDLFDAAGLMRLRHTPLQRLLRPSARRFALVAQEFDKLVGEQGLAQGSSWLVHRMAAGTQVSGGDHVPATGPVVVLANHPGMTDTVALLASLASRPDLRVIALDRPFLRALPNVARHLILVPDHEVGRMGVRAGWREASEARRRLVDVSGRRNRTRPGDLRSAQGGRIAAALVGQLCPVRAAGAADPIRSGDRQPCHLAASAAACPDAFCAAPPMTSSGLQRPCRWPCRDTRRWSRGSRSGRRKQACACEADSLRSAIVGQIRHLIEASAGPAEVGAARAGAGHSAPLQHDELALLHRPLSP